MKIVVKNIDYYIIFVLTNGIRKYFVAVSSTYKYVSLIFLFKPINEYKCYTDITLIAK